MTGAVIDASVAAKWFRAESDADAAIAVLERHRLGQCTLAAPTLLHLELLNVAARRWKYTIDDVLELATILRELAIVIHEVDLAIIARWVTRA